MKHKFIFVISNIKSDLRVWSGVFLVVFGAFGCQKGEEKSLEDLTGNESYAKASCEYNADEGEPAPIRLEDPELMTTHFGKKLDRKLLQPVLSASAIELVRFASMSGVDFKTVQRFKTNSCEMAQFLPSAESEQQDYFNRLSSSILGVYFSPRASELRKTNDRALILVRRDTNKWVMLHEYVHHLFAKEVQHEVADDVLKLKVVEALKRFEIAKKSVVADEKADQITDMVDAAHDLGRYFSELIRRYPLEEVAIESELHKYFVQGAMQATPKNQAVNGARYIESNAVKAQEWINDLQKSLATSQKYLRLYRDQSRVRPDTIEGINAIVSKLNSWTEELAPLIAASKKRRSANRELSFSSSSLASSALANHPDHLGLHFDCAHSKKVENLLNSLKQ